MKSKSDVLCIKPPPFLILCRLAGCQLTVECLEIVTRALVSEISQMRELDLSYNNLQSSSTQALYPLHMNSQCKVESLRLP